MSLFNSQPSAVANSHPQSTFAFSSALSKVRWGVANRSIRLLGLCVLIAPCYFAKPLQADERLKGIACRSVHLSYAGNNANAFYNEVRITESAPGTYFMVCGWNTGYFGMQELANGRKVILFSVWDRATGDDPNAVKEEIRVEALQHHPDVRVRRFGGEGTGGQSFYDFDWKLDTKYRFLVTASDVVTDSGQRRTVYSGYFYHPDQQEWLQLVSFSTITGGQLMRGFYSFVEDFKRDRVSTTRTRRASFGNTWCRSATGDWQALTSARFTADANPVTNIDAGIKDGLFFLATGGNIENQGTKLRDRIQLEQTDFLLPKDFPDKVR